MSPPIEGSSSHFFTADAAAYCASEIAQAGAVEVFFIAKRGEGGLIDEVESHAFGKDDCVPAITARAKPGDILIHNHPGGDLMPSEADLGIASAMGNEGIGFYIIDDECSRCRVIVKAHDPKQKVLLREKEVTAALAPRSALSHIVDAYEDRPQQRTMGEAVARAFNEDGIAVIEAGTGTGKSFAYLVPSILYALKNEDRVVISTNTINLQEQLLHKDIPMLRAAIGEEFEVEIVKGRSNYVCKRKAGFAADSALSLIEDEFQKELRDVLDWIGKTAVGDRGELPASPRAEVWERVGSEADNCLRVKCPFYEECFYYNSRRRAA
ncbi:MAG TPA: helicase, partial [Candidatus Sumerlaeota bacterium]|nr:helicase [Candidatus Sumerlaeota bacterium]